MSDLHYRKIAANNRAFTPATTISELTGETMSYAVELISRYTSASRNDCFALALAAQEQCTLLTGDKALRNAAEAELVMVRGHYGWLS